MGMELVFGFRVSLRQRHPRGSYLFTDQERRVGRDRREERIEIPGEGHWRAALREEPGMSGCGTNERARA